MKKFWMIILTGCLCLGSLFQGTYALDQKEPKGNSVTLKVDVEDIYKDLICLNKESYSLKDIEYTIYTDDGKDKEVAVFVLDENGVGYNKQTGTTFVDELADGDYYIEMSQGNRFYSKDDREYPFSLQSINHLPAQISVTTVAQMYGKNSSNAYFPNNQYKLWTTDYGTGIFECGIAEVDAPKEIVDYGTHSVSLENAIVLQKENNELIYKILYYGRSGPKQWPGFTSGRYKIPFTTRDGKTYYKTVDADALAAFITHVCLARAYGVNTKWNLQWPQDGVSDYWDFVEKAENAPDNFVVYIWKNYQRYGTQDMFFGFMAKDSDYDHKQLDIKIAPAFDPISIVLTKKDHQDTPIGKAGFQMDYYSEDIQKLPIEEQLSPKRSWVFETDEAGRFTYSDVSKISGDDLFKDETTGNYILLAGSYVISEIYAPSGYVLAEPFIIKVSSDISEEPVYYSASGNRLITNEADGYNLLELKVGYAKVNKRSASASTQSIKGAYYGVYVDENCNELAKDNTGRDAILITNEMGTTNVIELAPGNYYVKEISAPKGFKLDLNIYPITVVEDETAIVESVEESYQIELKLRKLARDNGQLLANAIYGVYFGEDQLVCEITMDENGEGKTVLPYREDGYYLKEIKAPEGYLLDKTIYQIRGDETSDVVVHLDLFDDPAVFRLKIVKVNESDEPLQGVGFQIVDDANEVVKDAFDKDCVGITDENGCLEFVLRTTGEYYLVETSTLDGYMLDNSKRKIVIDETVDVGGIDEQLEAMTIQVVNTKRWVVETGDREFVAFSVLSMSSFVLLVATIRAKKKYS